MTVEAKVAQILTTLTLAITAGSGQGVKVGDTAVVSSRVEVHDPDTGEVLGDVPVAKVRAKVTSVQARICVAKVTDTYMYLARKYLKTLTDDPELADYRSVYLAPGDIVQIEDDEPPF